MLNEKNKLLNNKNCDVYLSHDSYRSPLPDSKTKRCYLTRKKKEKI